MHDALCAILSAKDKAIEGREIPFQIVNRDGITIEKGQVGKLKLRVGKILYLKLTAGPIWDTSRGGIIEDYGNAFQKYIAVKAPKVREVKPYTYEDESDVTIVSRINN